MVDAANSEAREVPGQDEASSPAKKRRGRPRKCDLAAAAAVAAAAAAAGEAAASPAATNGSNKKRKKMDVLTVDASLVGQPVHGFLDGTFDAGYILTVRVGDTDTVLRGVIFGPGMAVPITKSNDIAPHLKFADYFVTSARDPATVVSPPPSTSAPGYSSQHQELDPSAASAQGMATVAHTRSLTKQQP